MKGRKKEQMKEFRGWLIISISFSFMFFIFAPLEIYLTNIQEFWFHVKDLFPVATVCFLLAVFILTALGFLLKRTVLFKYSAAIFFCCYLGLYIQGNFIPRNYGVLDGKEIDWAQFSQYGMMSIVLWTAMLILCVVLCVKLSKYIFSVCSYVGIGITLILIVTISTLFIQNIQYGKSKGSVVSTQRDMFNLSDRNNFIVLLYDTFDSSYMKEILESEDGDEYREILQDFTYYPNAIGGYPTTRASIPLILTGQWYENEMPFKEFIREAYKKTDFYDFLIQNQYTIGMYVSGMYIGNNTDIYTNTETGSYVVKDAAGFTKDLYKLIAFNYLPHQIKKYISVYTGDFDKYAGKETDDKVFVSMDVPEFVDLLKEQGITVEEKEKNAFRFYHLLGVHPSYEFGENLCKDGGEYTDVDEAKGCMQSLKYYCDMLKQEGIYDDSVIIVMADHGYQSDQCYKGSNPVFMIKEKQAEREFSISDMQVAWDDLIPTIKTLITGEKHDGDIWSFDQSDERTRRFLYFSPGNAKGFESLPKLIEYEAVGNPENDLLDLMPTGTVFNYTGSNRVHAEDVYEIEGMSNIEVDDKAWDDFALSGVSVLDSLPDGKSFRWTSDKASMFEFYVKDTSKNYRVTLNYWSKYQENSDENIGVKINGKKLNGDCIEVKENQILIDIPGEFITTNDVTVVVEFPNAVSPRELGISEDIRKLAITLLSVSIQEYMYGYELSNESYIIKNSDRISVGDARWEDFCKQGIGFLESTSDDLQFRWSTEDESIFEFYVDDISCEGYQFIIEYCLAFTEDSLNDIYAECNDRKLEVAVDTENQLKIRIPSDYLKSYKGKVLVHFPHAVSPEVLGQSEDNRNLTIAVTGVRIEKYGQYSAIEKGGN